MAKKGMQVKYKSQKRERNKYNPSETTTDQAKSFGKTLLGVLIFIAVMYLITLGLQKLGLFDAGYTAPTKEETKFDFENITVSTVFTRSDSEYYVLFDNYKSGITSDTYINYLLGKQDTRVYKVDMSINENAKYKGEEANTDASKTSELSINDITLIKISNGRIVDYVVGSDEIEEYLK